MSGTQETGDGGKGGGEKNKDVRLAEDVRHSSRP